MCGELMEADRRWADMVANVETTRTMAMQLWLGDATDVLGWTSPTPIVGAYAEPFPTWLDMAHLLGWESWPASKGVRGLLYSCGTLGRPEAWPRDQWDPVKTREALRAVAARWLEEHISRLLPGASPAGGEGFRWSLLADEEGRVGAARLQAQYLGVNDDPSSLYVVSRPGTTRYRLRVDDSGFENMLVVGDWTRTGWDAGCMEAAAISGRQASRAICGQPERIVGELPSRK
jgi:hypothetical protein